MNRVPDPLRLALLVLALAFFPLCLSAEEPKTYSVCSWNVENWLEGDHYIHGQHVLHTPKPEEEKKAVISILKKLSPDILAVQEIGREKKFQDEFTTRLKEAGLNYPQSVSCAGWDERLGLMLFSRFPMKVQTFDDTYTLQGETYHVERGFIQAEVTMPGGEKLTVLTDHLKSRRATPPGKPSEGIVRDKEAEALRGHMDKIFHDAPHARILVLGDMNDTIDSQTLKTLLGRGSERLHDLSLRDYLRDWWTEYYYPADTYSRIDFMLVSESLLSDQLPAESFIYREKMEDPVEMRWASASDHRPIFARFKVPK